MAATRKFAVNKTFKGRTFLFDGFGELAAEAYRLFTFTGAHVSPDFAMPRCQIVLQQPFDYAAIGPPD